MSYKFISQSIDIWYGICNNQSVRSNKTRKGGEYYKVIRSNQKQFNLERKKVMPQEEKKEIVYHPAVRAFDNKTTLITNVGFTAKADERFEILWMVPTTDEEAKDRYSCDLATLITAGIRQFSTRPNYKDVGFEEDGELKPNGHQAMQDLADGYEVGQRAAGPSQKIMAQKAKKAEAELDMTMEEMIETFKRLKEDGLI